MSAQPTNTPTEPGINVGTAMKYVNTVLERFPKPSDVYDQFTTILRKIQEREYDAPAAIERIERLFTGHADLISGFNTLFTVPRGKPFSTSNQKTGPDTGKQHETKSNNSMARVDQPHAQANVPSKSFAKDALDYLNTVTTQFRDNPEVRREFLEILQGYKNGKIDTFKVVHRVGRLFAGRPMLLQGFNRFLPLGHDMMAYSLGHAAYDSSRLGPERSAAEALYFQEVEKNCDPDVYQQFVYIMSRHQYTRSSTMEALLDQVTVLFEDRPDMRFGFMMHLLRQRVRTIEVLAKRSVGSKALA